MAAAMPVAAHAALLATRHLAISAVAFRWILSPLRTLGTLQHLYKLLQKRFYIRKVWLASPTR
jgi:hypothetical protein